MSDFGELCPLFTTGVYNELYLGTMEFTLWTSATYNFLSSPGDPATAPSSFRFGRTVVVTKAWFKRQTVADAFSSTICAYVGRRVGSGTAEQTLFGTICISAAITAFPKIARAWQSFLTTSFTLNTADVLDISISISDTLFGEFMIQYREK